MSLVKEFNEAFGYPIADKPTIPDYQTRALRVKLILEEAFEFARASGIRVMLHINQAHIVIEAGNLFAIDCMECWDERPNLVEAADGLGDLRYVVDGGNLDWGFPQEDILAEIHRSNMTKLGEDGKPVIRADGKFMKGPNYEPPKLKEILDEASK